MCVCYGVQQQQQPPFGLVVVVGDGDDDSASGGCRVYSSEQRTRGQRKRGRVRCCVLRGSVASSRSSVSTIGPARAHHTHTHTGGNRIKGVRFNRRIAVIVRAQIALLRCVSGTAALVVRFIVCCRVHMCGAVECVCVSCVCV